MQNIFSNLCFNMSSDFEGHIKHNRNIYISGVFSTLMLSLIVFFAAFPIINKTTKVEAIGGDATASTTSLTFSSDSENASLTITPTKADGTFNFSSDLETAKFNIITNNYTGYTLSIVASNDDGELKNAVADAALSSISTPTNVDTFNNSTMLNGKWGYRPSKYNSVANNDFLPSPTTDASTIDTTTKANNEANDYSIGLGVRVDERKSAGKYTNNFILTTVGNPIVYSITYSDDTGDTTVAGLPTFGDSSTNHTQSESVASTNVTLSSIIPTRQNYTFLKWCLGSTSNNGTVCTGVPYDAGASFGIDQTTANVSTLNAVWSPNITIKTTSGIASISLNGQNCASSTGCVVAGLVYGQKYPLTTITVDDGYTFSSWDAVSSGSIEDPTATTTKYTVGGNPIIITATTEETCRSAISGVMQTFNPCSNIASGTTGTLTDSRDNQEYTVAKIGDYYVMTKNLAISGTIPAEGSNFTGSDITPDYTDYGWFTSTYAKTKVVYKDSTYGGYYNYCLATAGTVCSNLNTTATQDICPANWRMPTSSMYSDIRYSSNATSLFAAQLGGYHTSSATASNTSYGYYWASNAYSSTYPYTLRATASNMSTVYSTYRYYGQNIRCVFNPSITVQVNSGTGISAVNINGGTSASTVTYTGHMADKITINATTASNYGPKYTWAKTGSGSLTASTNVETNTYTLGPSNADITVSATSGVAVMIKTATGISSVSLNGTSCTYSSGCYVTGLTPGATYDLVATVGDGYNFSSWDKTAGAIANSTSTSTRFTLPSTTAGTVATITPSATPRKYNITIKTTSGISKVSLNGSECTSSSGCTVWDLTYGQSYALTATLNTTGYEFVSWDGGAYGSVSDTTSLSTTYRVGAGSSTITPTTKTCIYSISGSMQSAGSQSSYCASGASGSMTDSRDGQTYTIEKFGNELWMTKNLAIGCSGSSRVTRSLSSSDSNVSTAWSTSSAKEFSEQTFWDDKTPYIRCNSTYGAWYSFPAASAGTIIGEVYATATYDICPKGWHLPHDAPSVSNNVSAFRPVTGGYISNGDAAETDVGYWWERGYAGGSRHVLVYYGSSGTLSEVTRDPDRGQYVRCVRTD